MLFPTEIARSMIRRGLLKDNIDDATMIQEKVAAFQAMCLTENVDGAIDYFKLSFDNDDMSDTDSALLVVLHKATRAEFTPAIIMAITGILDDSSASDANRMDAAKLIKQLVDGDSEGLSDEQFGIVVKMV